MSAHEMQKLSRENRRLESQLKHMSHAVSVLENKQRMHEDLNRKWQKEKQFLNQQIRQLRRREESTKYERQQTQSRYLTVLTKLQDELDERKGKCQRLENKIEPLLDHDTVRLKILNQVEGVHFMEVEELRKKNNQLKDEVLRLKRENEMHRHQIESNRIEFEDEKRRLRNCLEQRDKDDHLTEMSYEMCLEVENRLRLNYEQARKEADYYKDKYFTAEKKHQERLHQLQIQHRNLRQNLTG